MRQMRRRSHSTNGWPSAAALSSTANCSKRRDAEVSRACLSWRRTHPCQTGVLGSCFSQSSSVPVNHSAERCHVMAVKPIPEGYHSVTPYLVVRDAARAIDFYTQAFGATELFRMEAPDNTIGHAEIKIGDSPVMLADENPARGAKSPESFGGSPVHLMIYVEDVDTVFRRSLAAG